jgi:hypothetical protein
MYLSSDFKSSNPSPSALEDRDKGTGKQMDTCAHQYLIEF